MTALRVAVLFAGCGGSARGHAQAGDEVLYLNDCWPHAVETLRLNFPGAVVDDRSVEEVSGPDILGAAGESIDVLDASPPCQAFSMAGKRDLTDPRALLLHEVPRIASEARPRAVLIENVKGLIAGDVRLVHFDRLVADLRGAGYEVAARVLDASMLGVPQARERVLVCGMRADLSIDPAAAFPTYEGGLTVVRDSLPSARAIVRAARDCGDPAFLAYRSEERWPASAPSPTITTSGFAGGAKAADFKYAMIEEQDGSLRAVTVDDVRQLMGFPSEHQFPDGVAESAVLEMLGNAVPPPMARAWAESVGRALAASGQAPSERVTQVRGHKLTLLRYLADQPGHRAPKAAAAPVVNPYGGLGTQPGYRAIKQLLSAGLLEEVDGAGRGSWVGLTDEGRRAVA